MKFPKHILQIRDKLFDIGNDFVIEQDMDNIPLSMSFTIPYIDNNQWSTANIRKYDVIKLYFKQFDTYSEAQTADINSMNLEFYGYINTLPLNEDKSSGLKYTVNCKSIAGLLYEKTTAVPISQQDLYGLMEEAQNLLTPLLPSYEIIGVGTVFVPSLSKNKYFGNTLDELKEKYAIKIFQKGDGTLTLTTPAYFNNQTLNISYYDLTQNVFLIDYGNIEQKVDSVLVIGNNCIGYAIDPISMQLKLGVLPEDIDVDFTPTREQTNPLIVERRDIFDSETAQEAARNILIDNAKNYSITIEAPYKENQNVGDMILIINSRVISPTQKWIIKKKTLTISKTDIKTQLILYSNSIVDFPEDILRDSTGILDTDILNITEKIESTNLTPE